MLPSLGPYLVKFQGIGDGLLRVRCVRHVVIHQKWFGLMRDMHCVTFGSVEGHLPCLAPFTAGVQIILKGQAVFLV